MNKCLKSLQNDKLINVNNITGNSTNKIFIYSNLVFVNLILSINPIYIQLQNESAMLYATELSCIPIRINRKINFFIKIINWC